MTISQIIEQLSHAVTASGKKVAEIGKDAIFDYLKKVGVPRQKWEEMYENLKSLHEPKPPQEAASVDYSKSIVETKHREPRKKVFSEIKKIAG